MEIKIDTTKDEVEHIEHMITFLQNFVNANRAARSGQNTGYSIGVQSTGYSSNNSDSGVFGMFGNQAENNSQETGQSSAPSEGIFGIFGQEDTPSMQENKTNSNSSADDLLNDSYLDDEDDVEPTTNKQKIEITPY